MTVTDLNPNPVFELTDVSRVYRQGANEIRAVDSVSFRIDPGEFVVVAGPSGSGKTTLLQLLGALDRPTGGQIKVEGRNLSELGDGDLTQLRLRTIGFVFQQFNLIPTLTARENVEVALAPAGLRRAARQDAAAALLRIVGLAERGDHLPGQLSGGEQQRVAIARALANEPDVLLADEPTGNLDSTTGEEIVAFLRSLSGEGGQTVVLITHDPAIAAQAPRVLRMQDGSLVEAAPATAANATS
jgi:putative ABC transport system ATP-binding protein